MDISVLASVGSFVVSERVLKPKASVLVILGCVLAYDLTTKTHDVSSLRVYRGTCVHCVFAETQNCNTGPGLLAFSLLMVAWSLRTWRRNGVACDEVLFLPGTPYGEEIRTPNTAPTVALPEGDVAAGGVGLVFPSPYPTSPHHRRSASRDSSVSSIHEFFNSWDDDSIGENDDNNGGGGDVELMEQERFLLNNRSPNNTSAADHSHILSSPQQPPSSPRHQSSSVMDHSERSLATTATTNDPQPNITRIGNLFFFRSATSSTHSAAYAPSGPSVVGAAIDLCMPVLFNFHLFIEAYGRGPESDVPAKILPLIFLSVLICRTFFPFGRRGRFWSTVSQTAAAPAIRSRCRDSYIGDVLTSLIRPLQDVMFALAYYVTVIWKTVLTSQMTLTEAGELLQTSWWLHNVILPSCAMLPLWWKFLQTLRECYDSGQRWPHLGNSFKYLTAALVVLYGMTHPEDRRSPWWILAFAAALVYQIAWDTLVDWELFVIAPRDFADGMDVSEPSWLNRSVSPNSHALLALHRLSGPLREFLRASLAKIPSLKRIQIRPHRLYKSEKFYWRIFYYNAAFRFCWMLCFIPAYHLSSTGRGVVTTFSSDTNSYVGVLLPIAEIVRRTLWGFLYLEMKTTRLSEGGGNDSRSPYAYEHVESQETSEGSASSQAKASSRYYLPSWLGSQQQMHQEAATGSSSNTLPTPNCRWDYSERTRQRLLRVELVLWGVAFLGLGIWATT